MHDTTTNSGADLGSDGDGRSPHPRALPTRASHGGSALGHPALLAAVLALALFGASLVLLPTPVTRLFSLIAYGSADRVGAFGPDALAYVRLVHAILGAMTVGWALTMLGVVAWFWRLDPRRAWLALAVPAVIWFVLDSGYSIASGFWRNAVFNALFALAFAVPLLVMRRERSRAHGDAAPARTAARTGSRP